jgi:hypothetical protein
MTVWTARSLNQTANHVADVLRAFRKLGETLH